MNKQQQPVVESFNLNRYLQAIASVSQSQPLKVNLNDFQDEEDDQDEDRVGFIRRKRSIRAKRAMFDNE